jgi:hypothetical protein
VRYKSSRGVSHQTELFPAPTAVRWTDLPAEVRSRTTALLARLLRHHARKRRAVGVSDE